MLLLLVLMVPTATTVPSPRAVTPASALEPAGAAFGLAITLQLVPSQCSVRVCWRPVLGSVVYPAAQMSVAETAAIPLSSRFVDLEGVRERPGG